MRSRRLSFVAGWVALALLAVAGFAAFGSPEATPEELQKEAAAASIGHTTGAYAGLTFVTLSNEGVRVLVATPTEETPAEGDQPEATVQESSGDGTAPGTSISPATGWLSEVQVRALVKQYFEPIDVNRAVRIAWCESRFDPQATDLKTGGIGLFNHLPRYWADRAAAAGFAGAEPTDPEASTAAAAWEVYHGAGWEIFNCR